VAVFSSYRYSQWSGLEGRARLLECDLALLGNDFAIYMHQVATHVMTMILLCFMGFYIIFLALYINTARPLPLQLIVTQGPEFVSWESL
jgi:hypothetical protein